VSDDRPVTLHVDIFFISIAGFIEGIVVNIGFSWGVKVRDFSGILNINYKMNICLLSFALSATSKKISIGCIFSHVQPFYKRAVSEIDP